MTMGPGPMIRMLSISVRLGISAHQPDEMLEQVMAVLWTGACLWVVLHREDRLAHDPKPFVALIKRGKMGRLNTFGQAFRVDDKTMILAGDLHLASPQILDWVIGTTMAAFHFAGLPAERQR